MTHDMRPVSPSSISAGVPRLGFASACYIAAVAVRDW